MFLGHISKPRTLHCFPPLKTWLSTRIQHMHTRTSFRLVIAHAALIDGSCADCFRPGQQCSVRCVSGLGLRSCSVLGWDWKGSGQYFVQGCVFGVWKQVPARPRGSLVKNQTCKLNICAAPRQECPWERCPLHSSQFYVCIQFRPARSLVPD